MPSVESHQKGSLKPHSQIVLATCPRFVNVSVIPEPLTLDGHTANYCSFVDSFDTLICLLISDSEQRLFHLLKYTEGAARTLVRAGVGKLFVPRATFEKNVAAEDRTLALQNRKVYSLCKKTHILIKHSFCISHSGALGRRAPPKRTGLKGTRSSNKVKYLQESFTNILSCNVFNQNNK